MQANLSTREITLRGILLSIVLAMILAASNTYLALKIGILTSASIPAAIIAMGILRFFKGSNILENNLVQTSASAGEAIAGGIVYTIPALVIIHYWTGFSYWHNFLIALIGGALGIAFSIPLRRVLVTDPNLRFPEAQAISKVLLLSDSGKLSAKEMLTGSLLGAAFEFCQTGIQVVASSVQGFFAVGKTLFGFGVGFSATLIGAGYLIGFNVGLSLLIGAITGWLIIVPILSGYYHLAHAGLSATDSAMSLWGDYVRYVGIGAMLTAGIWTLLTLLRPMGTGIKASFKALGANRQQDVPMSLVLVFILIGLFASALLLNDLLPISALHLPASSQHWLLISSILCVLVLGFIFSAICGYFSGLVGVSASPGSAIVIGGLLLVALCIRGILHAHGVTFTPSVIMNACAIVIVLISVLTGIACITNDNIQDLKVGHILGSTPWKQQLMLLIGVIAASAIIPPLMQLLLNVYGIGGVMPHAGMDPNKMLPAPVPSVLAMVTEAVLNNQLPMPMLLLGAAIMIAFIIINQFLKKFGHRLSILAIAMGLYLPLSSSTPLFIGSVIALWINKKMRQQNQPEIKGQRTIILACGLVAGAALMDVLLAIPFALYGNPNVLNLMPAKGQAIAVLLGIISVLVLSKLFYRAIQKD